MRRIKTTISSRTRLFLRCERGNVFTFVLMGVALFAALAFTVSRGMRSQTTSSMTARQATLAATDILSYAQRIERAVGHVRRAKSCSENDISFENGIVSGYVNAGSPADNSCHIFDSAGGGATWHTPPDKASDGTDWEFNGNVRIDNLETDCAAGETTCSEILAILYGLKLSVCDTLNEMLSHDWSAPPVNAGSLTNAKFDGSFSYDDTLTGLSSELVGQSAFCFQEQTGGEYVFVQVLLAR